ncbi:MAG: Isoquinoline 1-oxidoreductase subunit [Shinella sp.]|uniref:Isoquinoline 1-oxidoreductase subunit n=1 Tax=Shinella sp. TaxID=1870904 RepID=UPI0040364D22
MRATYLILAPALIAATSIAVTAQEQASQQDRAASLAAFDRLVTVIEHPRCMNCHTNTDFPRQGNARLRHNMGVARGPDNHGTPALQCATCHQDNNSPSGVPGNASWHLAPLSMAWEGLDRRGICRQLTDPARSTMTSEQLVEHMGHDPLVLWAWNPGNDLNGLPREKPPIPAGAFGELVQAWVENGAQCPD